MPISFRNKPSLLVDIKEAADMTGLTVRAIRYRVKEGTFPKPKRIGSRTLKWVVAEIMAWIDQLETA